MSTQQQLIAAIDRGDKITARQMALRLAGEADDLRERLRRLGAAIGDHLASLGTARKFIESRS